MSFAFKYHAERIIKKQSALERHLKDLNTDYNRRFSLLMRDFEDLQGMYDQLPEKTEELKASLERSARSEVIRLEREIKELKKRVGSAEAASDTSDQAGENKAKTLAIFDSIIFAIENWASDDSPAPDFSLASQAVLFPLVYEKVMTGDSDYLITTVPVAATEVVARGREYVRFFRAESQSSLVDPKTWDEHFSMLAEWWMNDALPLLYGARADDWDESQLFTLGQMLTWRDSPASRPLNYPLIFDGCELVNRHADIIREKTGLPAFNKQTLTTRLNIHE